MRVSGVNDSFKLAIIPDTQQYVWQACNGSSEDHVPEWWIEYPFECGYAEPPGTFHDTAHELESVIQYITNEMDPPPLYVHQVGDLVESHVPDDRCEWELIDCLMRPLEIANIPWGFSAGNHEGCFDSRNQTAGSTNGCLIEDPAFDRLAEFKEFFPPSRFEYEDRHGNGFADSVEDDSMMYSWYTFAGPTVQDDPDSNKWLVINIGWFECDMESGSGSCAHMEDAGEYSLDVNDYYPITPSDYERLDGVITEHSDHNVIITQHRLIRNGFWTPQGNLTYHHLAENHQNVKLMICGHHIEAPHQHMVEQSGDRQLHVLMINYQQCAGQGTQCTPGSCSFCGGGAGYFHEVEISEFGLCAHFSTYSPHLGQHSDEEGSSFSISFGTPGDVNCDRHVNTEDLLRILATWGPCDGCIEDTNASKRVDVVDLLTVLQHMNH